MSYTFKESSREHRGHTITVKFYYEEGADAPWDNEDCHGPVSKWERRDKRPGEWLLCSDRSSKRFYDAQEAQRIAIQDGWDAKPCGQGTKRERAARAVKADFERLKAWCDDEWYYVCCVTEIEGMEYSDSLGMIESDYADEHEEGAFAEAIAFLDLEISEAHEAACRDVATL